MKTLYSTHTYFCSHRTLNPVQITDLLHFFLRSTYLQYNGTIYKEREGVPMESPLVAVFANLQVMSLEEYAMTTSPFKSKIRKLATSGWTVTRKPRDQLALVVSVCRVSKFGYVTLREGDRHFNRRSQEFRCLHGLLRGELNIQTLVLRPSKFHNKNNTQDGHKQCEVMHFK